MSRPSSLAWEVWILALNGLDCGWSANARPTRGGAGFSPGIGPTSHAPTTYAFSAGNGAKARGIGIEAEISPPLKAGASGNNQVPSIVSPSPTTCVKLSQTGANGSNVTIDHAPTLDETSGRLAILSSAGSPARTGASPGNEQASAAPDPGSSSTGQTGSQMSLLEAAPAGSSSRTSLGSSPLPTEQTSGSFSQRWPGSGTAYAGGFSTLDTSEFPSDAVECSLSDILEESPDRRFTLSPRAARGILRRASVRGRPLPPELEAALRAVAE